MKRMQGFTLVEILIVVIILGILAAIVIPQFSNASSQSSANSAKSTLQEIRSQIEVFKMQHNDSPPTSATILWTLLTTHSNTTETNVASPSGTAFGPYLQTVPSNPINGYSTATNAAAAGSGWYYTTSANNNYAIKALDGAGNLLTY